MKYFLDTCALLNLQERAFESPFYVSSVTLRELENIKTSSHKDEETKYKARALTRLLVEQINGYEVVERDHWEALTNDRMIADDANYIIGTVDPDVVFVTDDLCLKLITQHIYGLSTIGSDAIRTDTTTYTGFTILPHNEELMSKFYENLSVNTANVMRNEYVVIEDETDYGGVYKWTGEEYIGLYNKPLKSSHFGNSFKPKDVYQRMAVDSIMSNMVTGIGGPAGSGKSLLSLVCSMHLIAKGKYDRLVVLSNPTKARGSVDLGFYPGTSNEKLLSNSIGHMLSSKFGDRFGVEQLLHQDKLRMVSMGDIRGMEIRENEILYISECQNTTVDLLKLCLSRVATGAKVIFEGDWSAQVDSPMYAGNRNGMKRAVEVLKGSSLFGYIELQNVWRSELASLIEHM